MIPGEIFPAAGEIELNAGAAAVTIEVANTGDRPVQVGSHYHFFETNEALRFDRAKARGMRLDIAAGTADGDGSVGHDIFTGVQFVRGSAFADTLQGSNNGPGTVETFEGRGGDDMIDGRLGFDRAVYSFRTDNNIATGGIKVTLAAGTVERANPSVDNSLGSDTLRSIEAIRGTSFDDVYDATGFTTSSTM